MIHTPRAGQMFFLPQQPFMPLGTLRQQLLFPSGLLAHGSSMDKQTLSPGSPYSSTSARSGKCLPAPVLRSCFEYLGHLCCKAVV